MIRFYRIIRKKIIEAGNLKKYLFYGLGEVFLVMVGILLALQVNNINEERKKQALIKSQLLNLSASLKSDSSMWSRTLDVNEFRYSSFSYLLDKAGHPLQDLSFLPKADSTWIWQGPYPDSLDKTFIRKSFSWFTRGFDNIIIDRTAMNEINNLGLYSEIKNPQLKKKIHDYYMNIDFHFSNSNVQRRIDIEIEFHDYLRDKFGLRAPEIANVSDPIAFISNDNGILFRLKELRQTANFHSLQAVYARNMTHEIREMIHNEIGLKI